MRKAMVALLGLLALPLASLAGADEGRRGVEGERVEVAPQGLFAPPGPIYDESVRRLVPPPPRSPRDLLRRKTVLSEAVGAARSEPRATPPQKRGER